MIAELTIGIRVDNASVDLGLSTITETSVAGIALQGNTVGDFTNLVVGSPGSTGTALDLSSSGVTAFDGVFATYGGTVTGTDTSGWDACAVQTWPGANAPAEWRRCETRTGVDFVGAPPGNVALLGGSSGGLKGRVANAMTVCDGPPPMPPEAPGDCYQPGVYGGLGAPTFP